MRSLLVLAALFGTLVACGGSSDTTTETPDGIQADVGARAKGKKSGRAKGKKSGKAGKSKGKSKGKGKGKARGKSKGRRGPIGENETYDDNLKCCRRGSTYSYGTKKDCGGGTIVSHGDSCLLICCKSGGSVNKVLKGNCKGTLVADKVCGA